MLPEDFQDLVIAFALVILLVIVGSAFQITSKPKEELYSYESKDLVLRDEEQVFFLNLLRTKIEDKTIADLIVLSENDKELLKDVDKEIKEILDFYGKSEKEYGLKIIYPDNKEEYLGCRFEIDKGIIQKLPSLNSGLIELSFKFQGSECIEYWL